MSILINTKEYKVAKYTPEDRDRWDNFIDNSSNGTFLFRRSFMDYHRDRFDDNSCLIWENSTLVAVFVAGVPKNAQDKKILVAHPGLTYGGLVHTAELKYYQIEKIYDEVLNLVKAEGFTKIIIKPVARVFCESFSESHSFYFYKNGFNLIIREVNSVVDLTSEICLTRARKKNLRKAVSLGLKIEPSIDCSQFYAIMENSLLKTHGVKPVHTLSELQQLMEVNSDYIKLYLAILEGQVVGGTLLFVDEKRSFVHTQYTHANEVGRDARAIDALVMNTITEAQAVGITKLSFGISTVKGELNPGLLSQKEDFGSTIELTDIYEKVI